MSCTTVLVGAKASHDGSTMIARTDDGHFDVKKLITVNPKDQPKKYRSVISHAEVELPEHPMRYTSCPSVDPKEGIWAVTGINEAQVGMTATETITSNLRVLSADPLVVFKKAKNRREKDVIGGIGEEDFIVLVLPYIRSARDGVLRLAELLEKYGTYESNGIAFNDEKEVWWMETIGGHHWMARKVPDDRVVIHPNQFGMDEFDLKDAFGKKEAHLCSADLREFIAENHLDLNQDGKFNPRDIFGSRRDMDHIYNTPRAWFMGRYLAPESYRWDGENADFTPESDNIPWSLKPDRKVAAEDVKYLLSIYKPGYWHAWQVPFHRHQPYRCNLHLPDPAVCAGTCERGGMDLLRFHHLRRHAADLSKRAEYTGLSEQGNTGYFHGKLLLGQPADRRAGRPLVCCVHSEH